MPFLNVKKNGDCLRNLTHMNDASLGRVVRGLNVRKVDNVAAHARGRNEAAFGKPLKLFTVYGCLFLCLSPPV